MSSRLDSFLKIKWVHPTAVVVFYLLVFALFFRPILFSERMFPSDGLYASFYEPIHFWSNSVFSGYPVIASPENQMLYPVRLLFSLVGGGPGFNLFIVSAYLLASCFTYGYVYTLTHSRFAALTSGMTFGMSGFMMAHLGHGSMVHAAAWLPLLVWSVEELRKKFSRLWFTVGAFSVAMSIVAGHPQITVYTITLVSGYVLFTGRNAEMGWLKFCCQHGLLIILGVALVAIQIIPLFELARNSVRTEMSYEMFSSYSLPVKQIGQLIFPYIFGAHLPSPYHTNYFGAYNLTELTGYGGLFTILLATIGSVRYGRDPVARFWLVAAILAITLALGDSTPLFRIMYEIPVFNLFRAHGRLFLVANFAGAVLAGYAIKALQRGQVSTKVIKATIVVWSVIIAALLVRFIAYYDILEVTAKNRGVILPPAYANASLWTPIVVFTISAMMLWIWRRPQRNPGTCVLIIFVVFFDLGSFGLFYDWRYYSPSNKMLDQPAYLNYYKKSSEMNHQRIASMPGSDSTAFSPNESRLHHLEFIGGYGPLQIKKYQALSGVLQSGWTKPSMLSPQNRALDLLAVRYVTLKKQDTMIIKGIPWSLENLEIWLGGTGCGSHPDPTRYRLRLSKPIRASRVYIASFLACSSGTKQGEEILEMTLHGVKRNESKIRLAAGIDTADWAYCEGNEGLTIRHGPAPFLNGTRSISMFMTSFSLKPENYDMIDFQWLGKAPSGMVIRKITLVDEKTGEAHAINRNDFIFNDKSRWQYIEDINGQPVYKNLRAMPRAWLVPEVQSLPPELILKSIHSSTLPDGRTFEPGRLALVSEPFSFKAEPQDGSRGIKIIRLSETEIEIHSSSHTPAFLVASDICYPGWEVTVDGVRSHMFETNYNLRGVMLPPGGHIVKFVYKPSAFYLGSIISLLSVIVMICFIVRFRVKRGPI